MSKILHSIYFTTLVLALVSCHSKKTALERPGRKIFGQTASPASNESEKKQSTDAQKLPETIDRTVAKPAYSTSAQEYVERYKGIAVREMNVYGIPASITLAQGLLESGNGNSSLAIQANNHFGIKCTSDWQGPSVLQDDDKVDDCFRSYANAEDSFRDHSQFLLRKRYETLFELDKNDYKGWAHGLKKAGYATNPKYGELLIGLIERYELQQYDRSESTQEKYKREERVWQNIAETPPQRAAEEALAKPPVAMKIHEVKKGDTLFNIGKRYGLTVDELKTLNSLQDEKLGLGQLILVSK